MKRRRLLLGPLVLAVAILLGACGGDGGHAGHGGDEAGTSVALGEQADAGEADRTIEVTASDKLEFDPDSLDVDAGEVITFKVTNEGKAEHEFVLGDEAYQEEHEKAMAGGEHHSNEDANAVALPPGETAELTWHFTESGEIQFACHVGGHYEGGMFGVITVQ
ncbi:MAG: cupredoxin family protein [Actinomycetota bacterium]|nr:cupredoxin family protein [Actinomycetota bacterium]